jgi:hypothetical protein
MIVIDYFLGALCIGISILFVLCGFAVLYVMAVSICTLAYNVGKKVENKINARFNEI